MKFKLLTDEQLKELEQDFVQFLVANAVYKEEWEDLNRTQPDKALKMVELFSDVVYEKALQKISYLQHISQNKVKLFWFTETKAVLIGIDNEQSNFTHENWFELIQKQPSNFFIYSGKKDFSKGDRSKEIFQLMENGAVESRKELFEALLTLV